MKPNNFVKVSYWSDISSSWQDISNGIVSIDTKTGSDFFQGFWDQPDVGQFSILSKNEAIDPNVNTEIRFNTLIRINTEPDTENERPIFYGFITDVKVDYIQNDYPRINITGTDLVGYLNRIVITQDFINNRILPVYPDGIVPMDWLLFWTTDSLPAPIANNFISLYASRYGFLKDPGELFENSYGFVSPGAPVVKVEVGKTIYELIVLAASTGMIQIDSLTGSLYRFLPYYKYDSGFYVKGNTWAPPEETALSQFYFKSSSTDPWQNGYPNGPEDLTYKFITINDGFDRIINQVTVTNIDPSDLTSTEYPTSSDTNSISQWGPAKLGVSTSFSPDSNSIWLSSATVQQQITEYNKDIFDYQSIAKMNIVSLTVDMTKQFNFSYYPYYPDNGSEFYIQHKISNNQYLTGYYIVSGVRHVITNDTWMVEFILRESEYAIYNTKKPKLPIIQLNTTSGTTATTFTASISNYNSTDFADIEAIEWAVNLPNNWKPTAPPSQLFNLNKSIYDEINAPAIQNVPTFTAQTASWNYDELGPLVGYPSELYGPGTYTVAVWVRNTAGYTSCGWMGADGSVINVTAATAHADFIATVNQYNEVLFTDTSAGDTDLWEWDFGDGTTYNGQNPPKKIYSTGGPKTVSLTVWNGYDFDSIVKTVTIPADVYIPVKYIKLSYDATVTKSAGLDEYPNELISGFGGLVIKSTSTGGIRNGVPPIYLNNAPTMDAVYSKYDVHNEPIGEIVSGPSLGILSYVKLAQPNGNEWWFEYIGDYFDEDGDVVRTPYYSSTVPIHWNQSQSQDIYGYPPEYFADDIVYTNTVFYDPNSGTPLTILFQNQTPYDPNLHQFGDSILNPMPNAYGSSGYVFLPEVTNNPDGSQTKTIECEIVADYSKRYEPPNSGIPEQGGHPEWIYNWLHWDTSISGAYNNQRYKVKSIDLAPFTVDSVLAFATTKESSLFVVYQYPDTNYAAVTYSPATLSISYDGVTYRKVGTVNFTGNGSTITATTNYVISGTTNPTGTLPAKSNLPVFP